jgi:hypothetical protein
MKKVEDSYRSAPGLEWQVFKNLPRAFLWMNGSLLATFLILRFFLIASDGSSIEKDLVAIEALFIGIGLTCFSFFLFTAILCGIVLIAKGPQYTSDSYELNDSDTPRN